MKKLAVLLIFISVTVLYSCQPSATFDKPQPPDEKAISGFPKRIQGFFQSNNDNSILQITENSLIRIYDFDLKTHISQIDSTHQLIGDTLFENNTNIGVPVRIEGDSLVHHVYETDTVFKIDDLNVLKKSKGRYFINTQTSSGTWQVRKLEISRGSLTLSSINNKEDIEQLKELTETSQDTVPYVFAPTKEEFRSFVRNEGFRDEEKFVKIRK